MTLRRQPTNTRNLGEPIWVTKKTGEDKIRRVLAEWEAVFLILD